MKHIVSGENARISGIEVSVLRRWATDPKKGLNAAKLLRFGVLERGEYDTLPDGRTAFWNNDEMIDLYLLTGLDINGIAASIGCSVSTIAKYLKDGNEKIGVKLQQLKRNFGG